MSARCVCCGRRPAAAAQESGSRASIRLAPSLMEWWTPRRGHGVFNAAGPTGRMSHGRCEVVNSVRASFLFLKKDQQATGFIPAVPSTSHTKGERHVIRLTSACGLAEKQRTAKKCAPAGRYAQRRRLAPTTALTPNNCITKNTLAGSG